MKKVLENVILLLVTAILVIGIYNYVHSNEEPKEEDPIVDVLLPDDEQPGENETPGTDVEPGVETLTFNINHAESVDYGYTVLTGTYTQITYVEGMTWAEWVESDYNTIGAYIDGDFIHIPEGYLYVEDLTEPGIFGCAPSVHLSSVIGTERVMVDESDKKEEPEIAVFTYDFCGLEQYQITYEVGMTWKDFIDSDYNNRSFYSSAPLGLVKSEIFYLKDENGVYEVESNLIESKVYYSDEFYNPPVDEEEPEVENISTIVIYGSDSSLDLTIQYEEGMTWGDWLNSKYNTFGAEKKSYILFPQYGYLRFGSSSEPNVSTTDKIDNTYTYSTM